MKKQIISLLMATVLGVVLTIGVMTVLAKPVPVNVDPQSTGITRYLVTTARFSSVSYTAAQTATSDGLNTDPFGSVQIQQTGVVTGAAIPIAITVQFSNDSLGCGTASLAWTSTTVYTTTGSVGDLREIDVLGRCMRIQVTATSTFTPSVFLRFISRQ